MANPQAMFGWPMYSDPGVTYTPALSGGSWLSALPLANLLDRRLSRIARSTNALTTSTTFDIDLGVARTVFMLALVKHTITRTATVRWRASNTAGNFASPLHDSTALVVGPVGATDEDMAGINATNVYVIASGQSARYWRCDIADTGNAAGRVDIGRVALTGAWSPTTGMQTGAKLGFDDSTERLVTDGGAALYRPRAIRRTWDFSVSWLQEAEAFANACKMQRQLGSSGQLLFVFDRSDTYMHERAMLCVMEQLSAIEFSQASYHSLAFRLSEEL